MEMITQCDFSCMISPEMARKYVIPSVEKEVDFLDNSVYHFERESGARRFLEKLEKNINRII